MIGPCSIPFSYPVQLLGRLARQRDPQGPAELPFPFAALPELLTLGPHEPFPAHAPHYRLSANGALDSFA